MVTGLLRCRQLGVRLLPGRQLGKFALVPAAESGGAPDNGVVGWLQLPYDHPDFGRDFDTAETKLGVDAVKAADPYVDYGSSTSTTTAGSASPSCTSP